MTAYKIMRGDFDRSVGLAVAAHDLVLTVLLKLEDAHLGALALLDDGAADFGLCQQGRAGSELALFLHCQHVLEGDFAAHLAGQALDADDLVFGHAILLAAAANDCVHQDFGSPCKQAIIGAFAARCQRGGGGRCGIRVNLRPFSHVTKG